MKRFLILSVMFISTSTFAIIDCSSNSNGGSTCTCDNGDVVEVNPFSAGAAVTACGQGLQVSSDVIMREVSPSAPTKPLPVFNRYKSRVQK